MTHNTLSFWRPPALSLPTVPLMMSSGAPKGTYMAAPEPVAEVTAEVLGDHRGRVRPPTDPLLGLPPALLLDVYPNDE